MAALSVGTIRRRVKVALPAGYYVFYDVIGRGSPPTDEPRGHKIPRAGGKSSVARSLGVLDGSCTLHSDLQAEYAAERETLETLQEQITASDHQRNLQRAESVEPVVKHSLGMAPADMTSVLKVPVTPAPHGVTTETRSTGQLQRSRPAPRGLPPHISHHFPPLKPLSSRKEPRVLGACTAPSSGQEAQSFTEPPGGWTAQAAAGLRRVRKLASDVSSSNRGPRPQDGDKRYISRITQARYLRAHVIRVRVKARPAQTHRDVIVPYGKLPLKVVAARSLLTQRAGQKETLPPGDAMSPSRSRSHSSKRVTGEARMTFWGPAHACKSLRETEPSPAPLQRRLHDVQGAAPQPRPLATTRLLDPKPGQPPAPPPSQGGSDVRKLASRLALDVVLPRVDHGPGAQHTG